MARKLALAVLFLLCVSIASAEPEYKITYTVNIEGDGTAIWNVEYRTPLVTEDDFDSFENYTRQINTVYLNEFKSLMQESASEAAIATSRSMLVGDFIGDTAVEYTPTGVYGVVHYSFRWTNFARAIESNIDVGDAFVGGLYLSNDSSLIIQYPSGYTAEQVTPRPDQVSDGLIWDGIRSFRAGEPRIILARTSPSWLPLAVIALFIIVIGAFAYNKNIIQKTEKGRNNMIRFGGYEPDKRKQFLKPIIDRLPFLLEDSDIKPEVFMAAFNIAVEIAQEGREGKAVGTGFIIGDSENVMKNSRQLILNPFAGHPPEERMITLADLKDNIKELAQLDGVFVVRGDGLMEAAGRYLTPDASTVDLPKGLGTRHSSVAAITTVTKAVGIVVSQSGGWIRVIKRGKIEAKV